MLIVLTAILITLILLICGDKGSKSILSTAMNAGLLLLAVFLIYRGLDPILITVAACILIACITHEGATILPRGDSRFFPGDTVIAVTAGGRTVTRLEDLFAD